jgi:hypothetical protein
MRKLVVFCGAPLSFVTVLRLYLVVHWAVSGASVGSRQMQMLLFFKDYRGGTPCAACWWMP